MVLTMCSNLPAVIGMQESRENENQTKMTVQEAGRKGGQKVRDLIQKGEEALKRKSVEGYNP